MKYLFIQDRETEKWSSCGLVHFDTRTEFISIRSNRTKKVRYQPNWIYPKPENVSAFVKAHKIIEAETEELAWQKLN
uniref:Uncharacterized protein n=1 Tax=viral metagenome TaxID=1070528 RepID=A0A6M3IY45_9ZZZZ